MIDVSDNDNLAGYMNHSLSKFRVADYHDDQEPNSASEEFEGIEFCW